MNDLVSVVVVNWNGRHHLERCLAALQVQTYEPVQTILVDNGSTDGSLELVAEHFPSVRRIALPENIGFAAGNNRGFAEARGSLIATLNTDTEPDPSWLAELVRAIRADGGAGSCASKLVRMDRDVIDSAGICVDRAGIAWDRNAGMVDDDGGADLVDVFGACAGAALYRREMLDEIGGFDEHFFICLEDVDLAWRARLAGWRCVYAPAARVRHVHSASLVEGSPYKDQMLGRNKVLTIVKNYPNPELFRYLPAILAYDVASCLYALAARRNPNPLRGRLRALRLVPTMLRKRQIIQAKRQITSRNLLRQLHPVEWPTRVLARYEHLHLEHAGPHG